MYKKLRTLFVTVSRRCQELALEVVYVSLVLIHHGTAVQFLLCYSFSQVIVEEAVFYLLVFNWKYTSAWKRIGPGGGLRLEGHVRIQGHLILPRGVHIWPRMPASEGLSLPGRHWHEKQSLWFQGSWVSGCAPLKSLYCRHSGWFTVLIGIWHRSGMEHGGWGRNYRKYRASLQLLNPYLDT